MNSLDPSTPVTHLRHGSGHVLVDNGQTVVVRFSDAIHECPRSEITPVDSVDRVVRTGAWHPPLEVINRVRAEAIRSVNDAWGLYAPCRIAVLPHQLWVCRKVLSELPARWMVADDVGLGKTIEAGLLITALLSRGIATRILILTPATLAAQWQERLLDLFDIRAVRYATEMDTKASGFWKTHDHVVASVDTLRDDRRGRHERLLAADPWDLVVVDEAHRLNYDEQQGPTLAYQLLEKLTTADRVKSMVFFTGTPHRGKNFGFLALLRLLRPDRFNPGRPMAEHLDRLAETIIRNSKYSVTDLQGRRLFKKPRVEPVDYTYNPSEQIFYDTLTDFIRDGRAYASKLNATEGQAVMLVLIAMQKLASSSVAAIRRALANRLERIRNMRDEVRRATRIRDALAERSEASLDNDFETLRELEENLLERAADLALMEDEEEQLETLMAIANDVQTETKIAKIIRHVRSLAPDRSVLFFTEYKATQSLMLSALAREYGDDSIAFINGDDLATGFIDRLGRSRNLRMNRREAATRFNSGKARFLVSTEAGGEGIDLQENCNLLVHLDLPWNPMRMHQRVGRLNRYGQTETVEVLLLRNPETVESRIWDKLNIRIREINRSLSEVVDDPEDFTELVLGMTPDSFYEQIFRDAGSVDRDSLSNWFDERTGRFGGEDAVKTVTDLIGHCSGFDFASVSKQIPRTDLPDLEPFFRAALRLHDRRLIRKEEGLSFRVPEAWTSTFGVRPSYQGMSFDRKATSDRILAAGTCVFDRALRDAMDCTSSATRIAADEIDGSLFVFRIRDRVTGTGDYVRSILCGVLRAVDGSFRVLADWEILLRLNQVRSKSEPALVTDPLDEAEAESAKLWMLDAHRLVDQSLAQLDVCFRVPEVELLSVILGLPEKVEYPGKPDPT